MEILATSFRGDVKDLFTHGTIVLTDSSGKKIFEKGDGSEYAFPRSSAKLMQAMVPLSVGAADAFNLSDAEISQICASHSGEAIHIQTVRSILKKIEMEESALKCGAHYPFKKEVAEKMKADGIEATAIHNNCSGKHAGMLAAARILGAPTEDYYRPENEVQKRITTMISQVCEYPEAQIRMAVDGCGVPVHALPIEAVAYGMARLADPTTLPAPIQSAAQNVVDAMYEYPLYCSGSDRIDYYIMSKSTEKIVVKSGANGYFVGALPERKQGFALKCYEGGNLYKERILIDFLKKYGIIAPADYDFFDQHFDPNIYNHKKEIVGKIQSHLED